MENLVCCLADGWGLLTGAVITILADAVECCKGGDYIMTDGKTKTRKLLTQGHMKAVSVTRKRHEEKKVR